MNASDLSDDHYKAIAAGSMMAKAVAGAFGKGELLRGVVFVAHKSDHSFERFKTLAGRTSGSIGRVVLNGEFYAGFISEETLADVGFERDPKVSGQILIYTFCGTDHCAVLNPSDLSEVAEASKDYFGIEFKIGTIPVKDTGGAPINSKGGDA